MTLIELFFFALYAGLAAIVAMWGAHRYGWLGGVGGFLVGFFGLWAGLSFLADASNFFIGIIYSGRPPRPACRSGKCHSRDYMFESLGSGQYGYRCQCDLHYRKRGRRFYEVQPDGSVRPYMVWRPFRGWFQENP
jgi:hypothetical protein